MLEMHCPSFAMPRRLHRDPLRPLAVLLLALLFVACRGEPDTPEAQIRALVARAQSAAEEKNLATLRGMISERYADAMSNDKRALSGVVAYHLMRNRSIYLLAQVGQIDFPEVGRAEAVVYLAMAARPIASVAALGGLRADIYRFDLHLAEETPRDWKLREAQWRPAELDDLK
jgi:hypothetical protein